MEEMKGNVNSDEATAERPQRGGIAMITSKQADRIEAKLDRLLTMFGGNSSRISDEESIIYATQGVDGLKALWKAEAELKAKAANSKK